MGRSDPQLKRLSTAALLNLLRHELRTGAAQWPLFDKRYMHAFGAALNRGGNRVSAAEHNEIVMFSISR